jgi:hypothetical protein
MEDVNTSSSEIPTKKSGITGTISGATHWLRDKLLVAIFTSNIL